ncbi:MAG TPA: 3-phosphoshikimate 1-carboxyvinyltransferase [Candidatus Marinimicrobia bacterium]|nr:3-phosphoshikimate 1-carboxyvinyltransferase [Candidatus Neomarinimicrobiota bacterium]
MRKSVKFSTIDGTVAAPASKSVVQRVIAMALLAEGTSRFGNVTLCDDSQAAIEIARALGAEIDLTDRILTVKGGFKPRQTVLDCGESGLCSRLFAAVAALSPQELVLTGRPALCQRPADMIPEPLQKLGARCESDNGHLPLKISGPLKGGKVKIDGSISSQFLTGLLVALPVVAADSEISVENLKSKPYIDLTIAILGKFGIHIENHNYSRFFIPGGQKYQATEFDVEGDFSGAAFLLTAGALRGQITVTGLNPASQQADRAILELLQQCGARVKISTGEIGVVHSELHAFTCDANHYPDLFPPLVALAAGCEGVSRIAGAERLFYKESNRAAVLKTEFGKLGIDIGIEGDTMLIKGSKVQGGLTESHNDHRIAMALAIAGLGSEKPVVIEGAECVAKSYPTFFDDLKSVGGNIDE